VNYTLIPTIALISFLVIAITNLPSLASNDKTFDADNIGVSFMKTAFAQSPTASNNNSTDLDSLLQDNSTNLGESTNNSTNPSTSSADNSTNLSASSTENMTQNTQNQTSSATTPEFGNFVPIVLVISIISIVIISARTRLRFN
jgi:predicted secreted protein with PEFG-CTERM motif